MSKMNNSAWKSLRKDLLNLSLTIRAQIRISFSNDYIKKWCMICKHNITWKMDLVVFTILLICKWSWILGPRRVLLCRKIIWQGVKQGILCTEILLQVVEEKGILFICTGVSASRTKMGTNFWWWHVISQKKKKSEFTAHTI